MLSRNFKKLRPVLEKCSEKYTFSRNLQTLEPVKLSYATYEDISANPLLVMHGLFGSKSNWNSLCKVYSEKTVPKRKIVAIDARNHGDSPHSHYHSYPHMAEDIRSLLNDLKIEKVSLLGHSMGGRAVMLFALTYPEFVEKLIVGDISPFTSSPHLTGLPTILRLLENVTFPKNVSISKARIEIDRQLAKELEDPGLRQFLLTNLVQGSQGSYRWRLNVPALLENFENIAHFPLKENAVFNGPVLFVAGSESEFVPKSDFPKIQKLFPKAELKYIEGAGHWLHADKPQEFLKITLDFLNQKS